MAIHHIAIATPALEEMAEFYGNLPGLEFVKWQYDNSQKKRSAWVQSKCGVLLMIEREDYRKAPQALVFSFAQLPEDPGLPFTRCSAYTLYMRDPDKNLIGYSSFPEELPARWQLQFS